MNEIREEPAEDSMAEMPEGIAQTERIGLGDLAISGVIALATAFFLWLWEYPMVHPAVWDDVAAATGVRPATHVVPGFFVVFVHAMRSLFGVGGTLRLLPVLGHVALAVIAVLVYAALREMLAFIMRARPQMSRRRTFVMRVASIVGAAAFVCNDAVWTAGQCLSENTILMGLTLLAIEFFFVFLRKGTLKYAYFSSLALGLLCAETPMGFLLLVSFVAVNYLVLEVMPGLESPFYKPALIAVGKWYMTFIFLAALAAGITANCVSYISLGGLSSVGESVGTVPLSYLIGYWERITGAADISGYVLIVGVCLVPFIVTMVRFPSAADEETFLQYSTGVVFMFCGVAALSQSASLPALWFWTHCNVGSGYLLSVGAFLSAVTLAGAVTILGVDSLCRNHARLAKQVYGADDEELASSPAVRRMMVGFRRTCLVVVPIAILLAMAPGRVKTATRAMLAVIRDAVVETVTEVDGTRYLFTDGHLDSALEVESARRGVLLNCLSLFGGSSKNAIYLRTRGMEGDSEDLFSFKHDAGMGLRAWIKDRPAKLKGCAAQMGFDLWKRDGKAIPPMGGVMAHPAGWRSEEVRARGIEVAHALAARVLDFQSSGGLSKCNDKSIRSAFIAIQWRLARSCISRGECSDLRGEADNAIKEAALAKRLNESNPAYNELIAMLTRQNELMMQRLTPREGLQLALVRADFTMGKMYGETIVSNDPSNPDANFALGMFYLKENQLTRAEEFLKRCLVSRPNEPAVYNNLAMIQLKQGRLDAAETNVKKALALLPDSSVVLDTKIAIDSARKAQTEQ